MKHRAAVLACAVLMAVGCTSGSWAAQPQGQQSLDYVLRLIGRHASAHACAVGPRLALTSGHVIDPRPFDRDVPLTPYGWSDGLTGSGWLSPLSVEIARDLGRMEPLKKDDTFPHVLPVAQVAPQPGARVWFLGYKFNSPKDVMSEERIESHVTRIVANHVFYAPSGHPGSSGSCVLNDAGEVVGIVEGGFGTEDKDAEGGFAVGVWGDLLAVLEFKENE